MKYLLRSYKCNILQDNNIVEMEVNKILVTVSDNI